MPYTSRDEITTAVEAVVRNAIESGNTKDPYVAVVLYVLHSVTAVHSQITEKDIDDQLMTTLGGSPPVDILIRTSGVKRLSDFLLWQVCIPESLHSSFVG